MLTVRTFAALLGAAALAYVSSASAQTQNNPIPGIDVVVKKQPAGGIIARGQTDAKGEIVLKDLPAGTYTVVLTGRPLEEPAKIKGGGAIVAIVAVIALGKPVSSATKRVGGALESNFTVSEEDAKAKTLRLRISSDTSPPR